MPGKKSEQIKTYIVIGLSLVFVTVGYFRFIHKEATSDTNRSTSTTPPAQFDIPQIEIKKPQSDRQRKLPVNQPVRWVLRDIFAPLKLPTKTGNRPGEYGSSNAVPFLKLRGTIVGGQKPIAIINNQFLYTGDWIGSYEVVRIGKKDVLLDSGIDRIELEMVKSE
ncbi:MAG: hypothetical protein JRE23_08085 [Deltaproteobacteria bacterium]|nr:hypothetical protein [Deltaproteobacteria bacterium]